MRIRLIISNYSRLTKKSMEHSDIRLLTGEEKQARYDIVRKNLEKFYASYGQDKFGLGQQAKYTIVSAAINNEFSYFNFVGFYTVEKRMVSKTGKDVKQGGCLAKDETPHEVEKTSEKDEEFEQQSGKLCKYGIFELKYQFLKSDHIKATYWLQRIS